MVRPMNRVENRAEALRLLAVSRETEDRLAAYVDILKHWQTIKNLVAPSTLDQIWTRHVADSAQLFAHLGGAVTIADLGSGAGFPGLVLAVMLADTPGARVHLVESNGRKAAFLREAIRVTGAAAEVHPVRIEAFMAAPPQGITMVTARALAPLTQLIGYSEALLTGGARALFLKGQDVVSELTEATRYWNIESELIPSLTDPSGRIVKVLTVRRKGEADVA